MSTTRRTFLQWSGLAGLAALVGWRPRLAEYTRVCLVGGPAWYPDLDRAIAAAQPALRRGLFPVVRVDPPYLLPRPPHQLLNVVGQATALWRDQDHVMARFESWLPAGEIAKRRLIGEFTGRVVMDGMTQVMRFNYFSLVLASI